MELRCASLAVTVLSLGIVFTTACARRTQMVATPATPSVGAAAAPSNNDALARVAPARRKLLATALVSQSGGPCWDAKRHATILADVVDENGTPYILPHELWIDLDGDGTADPIIEVDRDATTVRYEFYLRRGRCSRHLGTVRLTGTIYGALGHANGMRTVEVLGLCDREDGPCDVVEHSELIFHRVQHGGSEEMYSWSIGRRWTTPAR